MPSKEKSRTFLTSSTFHLVPLASKVPAITIVLSLVLSQHIAKATYHCSTHNLDSHRKMESVVRLPPSSSSHFEPCVRRLAAHPSLKFASLQQSSLIPDVLNSAQFALDEDIQDCQPSNLGMPALTATSYNPEAPTFKPQSSRTILDPEATVFSPQLQLTSFLNPEASQFHPQKKTDSTSVKCVSQCQQSASSAGQDFSCVDENNALSQSQCMVADQRTAVDVVWSTTAPDVQSNIIVPTTFALNPEAAEFGCTHTQNTALDEVEDLVTQNPPTDLKLDAASFTLQQIPQLSPPLTEVTPQAMDQAEPESLEPPVHHLSFFGSPVYGKSDTPPSVSLAIILGRSRFLPVDNLVETGNLRIGCIVKNASSYLDPVVFRGNHEDLLCCSGTQLEERAIGACTKVYSDYGNWMRDVYSSDEDVPEIDALDEDQYHTDDLYFNGFMINSICPSHDEIFQEAVFSENCLQDMRKQIANERRVYGVGKSRLAQSYTPEDFADYKEPSEEETKPHSPVSTQNNANSLVKSEGEPPQIEPTQITSSTIASTRSFQEAGRAIQCLPSLIGDSWADDFEEDSETSSISTVDSDKSTTPSSFSTSTPPTSDDEDETVKHCLPDRCASVELPKDLLKDQVLDGTTTSHPLVTRPEDESLASFTIEPETESSTTTTEAHLVNDLRFPNSAQIATEGLSQPISCIGLGLAGQFVASQFSPLTPLKSLCLPLTEPDERTFDPPCFKRAQELAEKRSWTYRAWSRCKRMFKPRIRTD